MRAIVLILDGVGVGNAPDASDYDDRGADTLGHIFLHRQSLELPVLFSLGLREILSGNGQESTGIRACYGRMRATSPGKDLKTGHWEIAGVVVKEPFVRCEKFPAPLVEAIEKEAKIKFIGNRAGNGPEILEEFGPVHLRTGNPILYTSADSVMEIAAHEEVVPRERLYHICRVARRHCDRFRIGRVTAIPFTGSPGSFTRTDGRHDYPLVPPRTVLNAVSDAGFAVEGVGMIETIFGRSGITRSHPVTSNREGMETIERIWKNMQDGLVFAHLPDFDTLHGPGRDLHGFATALIEFDEWLGRFLLQVDPEDLLIITAGHGNDPTFRGTDRTREEVPVLAVCNGSSGPLGSSETFADVAVTLLAFFDLREKWPHGKSLLPFKRKLLPPFYH